MLQKLSAALILLVATPVAAQSYLVSRPPLVMASPPPGITPCVFGEFTGDGNPDLVTYPAGFIECYVGTATGTFATTGPVQSLAGVANASVNRPMLLGPVDFNGDGLNDLVRGGLFGPRPLINQGGGAFVAGNGPVWPIDATDMCLEDMDGVAPLELVYPELFATGVGTAVSIASYDPITTAFVPQFTIATAACTCIRTGDFNGDGARDILVCGVGPGGGAEFSVLIGNGLGTGFSTVGPVQMLSTVSGAGPVVTYPMIGDVTGDGIDDVLSQTDIPGTFSLHAGVSALVSATTLAAPVAVAVPWTVCTIPTGPSLPRLVDIDADGVPDLIWATCVVPGTWSSISPWVLRVWRGLGGGAFGNPFDMELLQAAAYDFGPAFFDLADMDGDGDEDLGLASASWVLGTVRIQAYENRAIVGVGVGTVGGGTGPSQTLTPLAPGTVVTASVIGGAPNATAALGLSLNAYSPSTAAGPVWLDLSSGSLVWPTTSFGVFSTSASGASSLSVGIPATTPAGASFFSQWIVQDPGGAYTLLGANWTVSEARMLVIF